MVPGFKKYCGHFSLLHVVFSLCRTVPNRLWQRLLKGQIVSLASRQRTLVELLQKQMHLVETYVAAKAKLSTQPPNHPSSAVVRQQLDDLSTPASTLDPSKAGDALSSNQDSPSKRRASLLRSAPSNNAPLRKRGKKTPTHSDGGKERASSHQISAPHPGNTSQHNRFKMKRHNALIQSGAEDNSLHLCKLIQRGVVPPGSSLQLLWKVRPSSFH